MEIVLLGPGDNDKVRAAGHLFDAPPVDDAVERFLTDDRHHLFVATRTISRRLRLRRRADAPGQGTEMLLYELAVDEAHRRQGIGGRSSGGSPRTRASATATACSC